VQDLGNRSGSCITPGPPDTTAPSVALTGLTTGATVHGSVPLSAQASDNTSVAGVEFAVDGTPIATVQSAPYAVTWDSTASSTAPTR
jgi:Bacterial Ig domain